MDWCNTGFDSRHSCGPARRRVLQLARCQGPERDLPNGLHDARPLFPFVMVRMQLATVNEGFQLFHLFVDVVAHAWRQVRLR